jgi:DNA-binding transcriptional regulator YiaG
MNTNDVRDLAHARRLAASGEGRAIREQAQVPQSAVAAAIEVTPSAVNRWEAGTRVPRGRAAIRWVRLLRRLQVVLSGELQEVAE